MGRTNSNQVFPRPDADFAKPAETAFVRLALTHFRGFRDLDLAFEPRPVVLIGPNGAGKTNILEAISMFAPGGGLRQARLGDVDLKLIHNAPGMAWAVHAKVMLPGGEIGLGTGRDPLGPQQTGRERRLARVNGAPVKSQAAFAEYLSVQWLVPAMDRLFEDGKSERRRFLDRLTGGIDPDHGSRIASYEGALRERGRILRSEVAADVRDRASWLEALEAEMAAHAIAIAASRMEALRLLNQTMEEAGGPLPRAVLFVNGAVEEWLGQASALIAEERLREKLMQSREEDTAASATHWGTHRTDLQVQYAGRELGGQRVLATDCSTGEQRALLLSIAIAQSRLGSRMLGRTPVLLLDEALAHLDARRRDALFEEVLALGLQAFLTGSDPGPFRSLAGRAQFVELEQSQAISSRE